MYVVVERHNGGVFGFGATPEKASADFVREGGLPEEQFFAEPFVLTGT